MRKNLAEFSILCSVVVCYLLNKRMATYKVVPYCLKIAEHYAPVIPQSIRGRIPHSSKYSHLLLACVSVTLQCAMVQTSRKKLLILLSGPLC